MSFQNKTGVALKSLLESKGEDGATIVVREALKSGKLNPEDFSLREIWEACTNGAPIQEAVASSSFPKITGELINARLIAAYNAVPTIGDMITTTVKSTVQNETVAGISDVETPEEVGEGQEYNDSTVSEKFVTGTNKKFGRMISVTEEMIYFDKTGQVLNRAKTIGMKAAQYKEKLIVEGVQDVNSNVWKPSGTPTAFYSTTNRNLQSSNPFGEAGMAAIRKLMTMQKSDAPGTSDIDYIFIDTNNLDVIVPVDLEMEAWQLANSALTPESAENALNFFKGRFRVLSSPFVSQKSTTTWYAGNFKEDFWWTEVWPLQVLTQRPGHEDEFKRDIKSRTKVRFYGNVMAVDTKHSYKATA